MSARVLTFDEYAKLAEKALATVERDANPESIQHAVNQLKQAHRLLCEGRSVEGLTPVERFYAAAFKGALLAQVPNDYGWEPGIEVEIEVEAGAEPKPQKPKKNGK